MASERPNQTAVDYVTIVLSPVLIMGLVGSLAFFLLEILYKSDGEWRQRLQWTLFYYVFGAVLVARISMNYEIASRAPLYGSVLALLAYMGLQSFIEYPPGVREVSFVANIVLVVSIWWCTHRLVWDCTNVDEETDMSGEGLLQASGLEDPPEHKPGPNDEDEPVEAEVEGRGGFDGWFQRFQKYRERKNKKRTLGVWVVYFSMAALPIFGLGQALLPLTSPERRRFTFWMMTIYIACGLGLLLTTCFLGLRRYLRQKRLQMPAAMTGAWLTLGAMLLGGLLLVGALLPRPYSEYPVSEMLGRADSAKRNANRVAFKGDSPGQGEGQRGNTGAKGDGKGGQAGEKGKGAGEGKSNDGKQGKGEGKGAGQGDSKDGQGKSEGDKGNSRQDSSNQDKRNPPNQDRQEKGGQANQQNQANSNPQDTDRTGSSSPRSSNPMQQVLQKVAPVLKWVIFGILALVVVLALFRGGLGFLANFTDWARRLLDAWKNFWANLFGGARSESSQEEEDEAPEEESERNVPFSAFDNPFSSGEAQRLSARELVRYSFRALEAWARDRDLGREPGETALEFLDRLAEEVPALEAEAKRLGQLHARAEYARGGLPAGTPDQVRAFWDRLERVSAMPLSA